MALTYGVLADTISNRAVEILVRPAKLEDAELLVEVAKQAFAVWHGIFNPPSGTVTATPESVAKVFENGGGFIAEVDGKAVGCVLFEARSDHVYLSRLGVLPEANGKGISKLLASSVEEASRSMGVCEVRLATRLTKNHLVPMYEKFGYTLTHTEKHESGDDQVAYLTKILK